MWVCPTKKQDEFYNIETLISLLEKEFPQYIFEIITYSQENITYIDICLRWGREGDSDILFRINCYTEFPYLDSSNSEEKTRFIDELDEMKLEDLADKMISFLENDNMDLNKCIEIRHTPFTKDISLVTRWMRQYFQAIIMDEGIHPEFILPIPEGEDYKPKNDKSIIKKFGDWLSK